MRIQTSPPLWLSSTVATAAVGLSVYWYLKKKRSEDQDLDRTKRENTSDKDDNSLLFAPVREILLDGNTNAATTTAQQDEEDASPKGRILARGSITIVHASVTGTCAKMAQQLYTILSAAPYSSSTRNVQLATTEDFDWWDEFINDEDEEEQTNISSNNNSKDQPPALLILLLPTYTEGTWPPCASNLQAALKDLENDWRVAASPLRKKLQVAVWGMGSSEYDDDKDGEPTRNNQRDRSMGRPARQAVRHFQKLGARSIVRLRVGDDAVGDAQDTFDGWKDGLLQKIGTTKQSKKGTVKKKNLPIVAEESGCGCSDEKKDSSEGCCQTEDKASSAGCCQTDDNGEGQDPADDNNDDDDESYYSLDEEDETEPQVIDLEDMGEAVAPKKNQSSGPREMVTPRQAQALKKEGYKLIGTHSAVKLCRWTKHQLRGRGGCYKHTFYGITSYQCMEATPSLACANKCVFCWRHHKNPVGKEWRWKTDDPHFIVDQAVKAHIDMIKETKGIPGVRMDRWKEAHTVRHCALSLVGEPIMYPRIDEFLEDLHQRKISTFLVTNGQHPQAIGSLRPITQLYVSVDAPTQESLIAIDRPLFQDAWDRLKQSLVSLKDKGQRTVARLTVVKGWNSDEVSGYAELIALGAVSLVEVKGVTFCGKSDASNLNMSNTPWHHEVVELTQTLKKELDKIREKVGPEALPEYGLACEHKHSCSVLLARVDQFAEKAEKEGQPRKWRTWIDYDKFHELAVRHAEDPSFTFGVKDYTAPTPSWALFGADEEGFDPTDTRHRKQKKHPKYTQFDARGVPTHDHEGEKLSKEEHEQLARMLEERQREIGAGTTVTELKGGEKAITDASLMFRGMVVAK